MDRGRHQCPQCGQTFTRNHNLKSHMLTHSEERPYSCETCKSKFRRIHDLKRHLKLHTGERPHECSKCGRRFARTDALARHTRVSLACGDRPHSTSPPESNGTHDIKTAPGPVDQSAPSIPTNITTNNNDPTTPIEHRMLDPWAMVARLEARTQSLEDRLMRAEARIEALESDR
uniref:ARAD1D36652p n=1 Tax=Blastobotrys adeninivorans TaxID=409370 RepID=A0A060TI74_BLAAD